MTKGQTVIMGKLEDLRLEYREIDDKINRLERDRDAAWARLKDEFRVQFNRPPIEKGDREFLESGDARNFGPRPAVTQ